MSRKLDAAIAEALGIDIYRETICTHGLTVGDKIVQRVLPNYSTDGNAMLELDREMRERGCTHQTLWAYWDNTFISVYMKIENKKVYRAKADTEPLARALATYKTLTGKEWEEGG